MLSENMEDRQHQQPKSSAAEKIDAALARFHSSSSSSSAVQAGKKRKRTQKKSKDLQSKDNEIKSGKLKKSKRSPKRFTVEDLYDSIEDMFNVKERGGKLLATLPTKLPGFGKRMLPTNVTYSFWLLLPKKFCDLHLPPHDATIILQDEFGEEYKTTFLRDRSGLSAGWRGFSNDHHLLKGDILIFQLIEPCKLKVYIARVRRLEEIDAAISLMSLAARPRRKHSVKKSKAENDNLVLKPTKKGKRTQRRPKKFPEAPSMDSSSTRADLEDDGQELSNVGLGLSIGQCETNRDVCSSSAFFEDYEVGNNESSCSRTLSCNDQLQKSIGCRSPVQQFYSTTALTT